MSLIWRGHSSLAAARQWRCVHSRGMRCIRSEGLYGFAKREGQKNLCRAQHPSVLGNECYRVEG